MAFSKDDLRVIKNTREEFHDWRQSETPVFDAIHTILEIGLIWGQMWRFLYHGGVHSAYLHDTPEGVPEYSDEDFRFTAIAHCVIEPVNWRQEALMRGSTCLLGLIMIFTFTNTPARFGADMTMIRLQFWVAVTNGGYLLFDPLLGVALRIANR